MKTLLGFVLCCVVQQAFAEILLQHASEGASYAVGETVRWTIRVSDETAPPQWHSVHLNGGKRIAYGPLEWKDGSANVEVVSMEPAMLRLDLFDTRDGSVVHRGGAAIAPDRLHCPAPEPEDFDAFWKLKIESVRGLPMDARMEPADSGRSDVELQRVSVAGHRGSRVHGFLAKPAREGKFPALLILQWAGGPYPLQPGWSVDPASKGWLALNIEPHDVPPDMPQAWYDALPKLLKEYQTIGDTDRERSHFLAMYLGAWRAVEYLRTRPEWDGRTLVAIGSSMGGQQALAVAGLHSGVTHVLAHTPAGCDVTGPLSGRSLGYPYWNVADPRVAATAPYFDPVNFASRVRVPVLVSAGFIDTVTPPHGILMAFNRLVGPKELVPMPETPHGHHAKPGQEKAFWDRRDAWLSSLLTTGSVEVEVRR